MNKDFKTAVDSLDAQRVAPVEAAKRDLAPVRAKLLRLASECDARAAKVRPIAAEVQAQVTTAASRGLVPPVDVTIHLREAFGDAHLPGLLSNAGATCRLKVLEIDQLSGDDVYQGRQRSLAGAARNARPLLGALGRLETALKQDRALITDLIRRAAGVPSTPSVVNRPESPTPVKVEVSSGLHPPYSR